MHYFHHFIVPHVMTMKEKKEKKNRKEERKEGEKERKMKRRNAGRKEEIQNKVCSLTDQPMMSDL